MLETIKQIYDNVTTIFNKTTANYIGNSINHNATYIIKNDISYQLKLLYPSYNFNIKLNLDTITQTIMVDFDPDFSQFPMISYKNWTTHEFILKEYPGDTFAMYKSMYCTKCDLRITELGNLLDGDFSCEEFIIKNIIE